MSPKKTREQVSARLDTDVLEVVQHVAEVERRPISNLVRNIVSDWVRDRETAEGKERAA
jgi:predicted transcriptional regulator